MRPDQRAMEKGEMESAIKLKHQLEEAQRARRKEMEKTKTKHKPAYFEIRSLAEYNEAADLFQFTGKYWEDRANRDWSKLTRIYDL